MSLHPIDLTPVPCALELDGELVGLLHSMTAHYTEVPGRQGGQFTKLELTSRAPDEMTMDQLREQLFAASRRLGRLKTEFHRRQRESRRASDEVLTLTIRRLLDNPEAPTN